MAIQLLPGQSRTAGLGQALGTGLGQGLQMLAQDKLMSLMKRKEQSKTATGLQALGIPQQEAANLSMLPKELLAPVVKDYLAGAEGMGIEQALASITGEEAPEARGMQALVSAGERRPEPMQPQAVSPEAKPREKVFPTEPVQPARSKVAETLRRPRISPADQLKIAKMKQQQEQFKARLSQADQKDINKETLPYYKDVIKKHQDAKENQRRLGRMEEIVRKGKLDSPTASAFLNTLSKGIFGFGINLDALRSPDSQEFQKLSVEFLKGAKAIFGARVTQKEMEMFLKMVPTLVQSDKGKLRVINNMKAYMNAELIRKKAMDEIIDANKGKRPANLESKVETAIEPALDRLAEQFKKGYNIEAEPAEEKSSYELSRGIKRAQDWLGDLPFKL